MTIVLEDLVQHRARHLDLLPPFLMKAMKRADNVSECTPKQELFEAKAHLENLRMMIKNTLYGGTSTGGSITDVPSLLVETVKQKLNGCNIQSNFTNDTQSSRFTRGYW